MQYISPARDTSISPLGPRRHSAQLDLSWQLSVHQLHHHHYHHHHTQAQIHTTHTLLPYQQQPSPTDDLDCQFAFGFASSLSSSSDSATPYPSPPMSDPPALPPRSQEANVQLLSGASASASVYHPMQSPASFYPVSMTTVGRTEDLYRTNSAPLLHQSQEHPQHHQHTHHHTEDLRNTHSNSQHPAMSSLPLHHPQMATYQPIGAHAAPGIPTDFDRIGFYDRADAHQSYIPHPTAMLPSHHQYGPATGQMMHPMGGPLGFMYSGPARVATVLGTTDLTGYGSPKSSRKAKGHVASACVPCKKAHLRCDAHRPCSRCIMNGKEDSCIDVQHKKRGRPRLRDDREIRFDTRFPSTSTSVDASIMRRPMGPSSYSSSSSTIASGYANTSSTPLNPSASVALTAPGSATVLRHSNHPSFRVLKSQPRDSLTPRFPERVSTSDASLYSSSAPALTISTGSSMTPTASSIASASASTTGPTEPVAYLMLNDLEIIKASPAFLDAIGLPSTAISTYGIKLEDILASADRERLVTLNAELRGEQERSQPTYLPPILTHQQLDQVVQGLGFGPDEIAPQAMDRHDRWTFQTPTGQQRTQNVRFGLIKQDSLFFVILHLIRSNNIPYPSPSTNAAPGYNPSYQPQTLTATTSQQTVYGQPTPVSATFDPSRVYGDSSVNITRQIAGQILSGPSPGISPGFSAYAASPSRPDYALGPASFQTPRTEITGASRIQPQQQQPLMAPQTYPHMQMHVQAQAQMQQGQVTGFQQLPPIRGQSVSGQAASVAGTQPTMIGRMDSQWLRDERNGGRVGIEGLLERPSHAQQQPPSD